MLQNKGKGRKENSPTAIALVDSVRGRVFRTLQSHAMSNHVAFLAVINMIRDPLMWALPTTPSEESHYHIWRQCCSDPGNSEHTKPLVF
jgi:hypothetical protein